MFWDFIGFGILTGGYLMLSASKTLNTYKAKVREYQNEAKSKENQSMFNDTKNTQQIPIQSQQHIPANNSSKFNMKAYTKKIINYSVAFNSSFLIVGSMSEAYYYSITMVGNIFSVTLGFLYAFFIVHPFMHSLPPEIKTPYQYFEKRYRCTFVRSMSALMAMFFYFSFLTLFLWGCTILLCTLIPEIPFWLSSLIIGTYSIVGSSIGGFQQATMINLTQFVTVIAGLLAAIIITITKSKNSFQELWTFAYSQDRTNFFEMRTNIKIRYTLLNQLVSLPMPWTAVHSLLLPNFIRYRSIEGKLKSRFLMVSNFPAMVLVNFIVLFAGGVMCFLFFYGCDPYKTFKILNKNQIGTYWIYLILSEHAIGLTGVLFSSIICYSVVQHSSGMALCANTLFDEVFKPLVTSITFTEPMIRRIKLIITILLGILSILYCISFQFAKNTMLSLFFLFNNTTNSPILGLFLLSAFNPYANAFGAIAGFVTNLLLNYWFASGALAIAKEFPSDNALCNSKSYAYNYENFDFNNMTYYSSKPIRQVNQSHAHDVLMNNYPVIYWIFSVPAIWYCIFSVCVTFTLGSFYSFAYSLITTRSLDADSDYSNERKKYLYYYKLYNSKTLIPFKVRV